jgi:hypothetical protein
LEQILWPSVLLIEAEPNNGEAARQMQVMNAIPNQSLYMAGDLNDEMDRRQPD